MVTIPYHTILHTFKITEQHTAPHEGLFHYEPALIISRGHSQWMKGWGTLGCVSACIYEAE